MDTLAKIDLLLQYTMAVACRLGFGSNELRPIHLIKYLYLADLEYAKLHNGETFTGVPWRFHHFGPWAQEVFQRIEPALLAIGAEKKTSENMQYGEYNWALDDCDLEETLRPHLEWILSTTIDRSVREFGAGTEALLHRVYTTTPMLQAAPEERLEFLPTAPPSVSSKAEEAAPLTIKQQKRLKEKVLEARAEIQRRLAAKREAMAAAPTNRTPRYDDVYFQGLSALDAAAGELIKTEKCTCSLSPDVWKSKARYDPDLS